MKMRVVYSDNGKYVRVQDVIVYLTTNRDNFSEGHPPVIALGIRKLFDAMIKEVTKLL